VVARLGVAGAAAGVVAGGVQASFGERIPAWTGGKAAPLSLGLLTIALAALAGAAALAQTRSSLTAGSRAACAAVLVVPALLCFSTVGRLWYLPGPLLLLAAVRSLDSCRDTVHLITANWLRVLLGLLGAAELLMAAGARPALLVVGAAGGVTLVVAARVAHTRAWLAVSVLVGALPFAVLAFTAVVPVVLLLVAAAVTAALVHRPELPFGSTAGVGRHRHRARSRGAGPAALSR
jgi:hypothetical protein